MNEVMPGSDGFDFLLILNKSSELRFGQDQAVGGLRGAHARWLSQWVESWRWTNSQHRKIVSLSRRVANLNLKKVIKVSYVYQESRQCFECISGFICVRTFYEQNEHFIMATLHKNFVSFPDSSEYSCRS